MVQILNQGILATTILQVQKTSEASNLIRLYNEALVSFSHATLAFISPLKPGSKATSRGSTCAAILPNLRFFRAAEYILSSSQGAMALPGRLNGPYRKTLRDRDRN